jgi:hypothetical protein
MPSQFKDVGGRRKGDRNYLLGNRRSGARACNDDDKTWAESGSHSESKTGLSLYRSVFLKTFLGPGYRMPASPDIFQGKLGKGYNIKSIS